MVAQGKLALLEELILKDSFNLSDLSTSASIAEELIRYLSDGLLYGVALKVYAKALFYNADLFEQYGIPVPTNYMTWPDVMELAARFPTQTEKGDPLYGLELVVDGETAPFLTLYRIADYMGLRLVDAETGKLLIFTPEWREVWDSVATLMRDGHLPAQRNQQLFRKGQSAMLLDDLHNYAYHATRMQILIGSASALGIVTPPVDPKNPSGEYSLASIYSISATSEHKEEAWQFIRYMLEREKAEQQREWKEYDHIPFESLYTLTPKLETVVKPSYIPNSIAIGSVLSSGVKLISTQ